MSLINEMLDELEKTAKRNDPKHQEALSGIDPTLGKQKNIWGWRVAYWAVILIIATGITWQCHKKIITTITKTVTALNQRFILKALQKKTVSATVPIAAAIKLQNITLEQKNNQTILDFMLSAPTPYYIEHGSEQQLFITLNNVNLLGNLPVSLENTFIIALNTKQNSRNIVSTLNLLPGTKIDELQMINAPQPHLHLVFSNQQLTSSSMTKKPIPTSLEQKANERYQEIQQLLKQNEVAIAIPKLHMFIGDFPNHLQAREMLASLLIKEGLLQKANHILTVGLNKHQGYSPFVKLKANVLVKQNDPNAAIELLQKYLSSSTDDVEYLALLAAIYQQQGKFILAAEIYNQLTKAQPQKTSWWLGLGIALESAGKKNGAKEAYRRAYMNSDVPPDLREFLNERIKK